MYEDLPEIVGKGDLRSSLQAIRDLLAHRLVEAEIKESATVAKQLMAVILELDRLPSTDARESTVDKLAREYAERKSDSASQ